MRGCLFTLLLGAVALALLVVVGLPAVAAGILTSGLAAAGLQADDTTVTVSSDPPTDLIGLRADRVRVRATDARFRELRIGALDVVLRDVAILDRTARGIDGELSDVTLTEVGDGSVTLDSITLGGAGDRITASTVVDGSEAETLIARAVEARVGVAPESVRLSAPDRLRVDARVLVEGRLSVSAGGDLVVRLADDPLGIGDIVLLRGGEDLPIRLTDVRVTRAGDLRLDGDLSIAILG